MKSRCSIWRALQLAPLKEDATNRVDPMINVLIPLSYSFLWKLALTLQVRSAHPQHQHHIQRQDHTLNHVSLLYSTLPPLLTPEPLTLVIIDRDIKQ